MAEITISGLDQLQRKLKTIERLQDALDAPMNQSLLFMERRLDKEPRKAAGAFSAFTKNNPAVRRAYWARVSKGEIDNGPNGYVRTHTLSRKWVIDVKRTAAGLRGEVGNNSGHAVFVQGERQQPFHRASGYKTVDQVADESEGYVTRTFNAAIKRVVEGS